MAAVSFDVHVLPPAVSSVEPSPEPPPESPTVPVKRNARRVAESAPAVPAAGAVEPPVDAESVAEQVRPAPALGAVDLSPLAAARSVPLTAAEGGSVVAQPRVESAAHQEARLAEGIPGLVRDKRVSERSVGEIAQDLQGVALRPWDLILHPLKRGRYRYRGQGFDAVIAADGSVKYRDKDGPRLSVGMRQDIKERRNGRSPYTATFAVDLGDPKEWVDKIKGKDPHASERRNFLERTRPLREYLREQVERSARETRDGPPPIE